MLDYNYFKSYKIIAVDLTKQQEIDADPKAIQQINFTGNLDRAEESTMFSLLKKWKKQFWIFHKEQWKYCEFILLQYNISIKY